MKIEVKAALWHKILGHLPFVQVEAGLAKVFMTASYFPTIAEILEAADSLQAKPEKLPSPDEVWDEIYRHLDPYRSHEWSHEAIKLTVKRLGGIRALCDCDNLAPARAHFFKLYDMIVIREKEKVLNEKVAALVAESKISYLA